MRKRKLLWVPLLVFCPFLWAQQTGFLDLTNPPARPRDREPTSLTGNSIRGGMGDGFPTKIAQPLRLTLSVDSARYREDDRIIYEVKLENVSARAVDIPWDPNIRDIEPGQPGNYQYEQAAVVFSVASRSGYTEALGSALIFGSKESHTLHRLEPGQWVTVRASTMLKLRDRKSFGTPSTSQQVSANVRAGWNLYHVNFYEQNAEYREELVPEIPEIMSENSLPIEMDLSGSP